MGEIFRKARTFVKKADPELVSFALSGLLLGILVKHPQYADQLETAFKTLKALATDEHITEDMLHNEIQRTLTEIGVKDPNARLAISLFLQRLDRLAERYLDVVQGEFAPEERQAWEQVFEDLIATTRLFRSQHEQQVQAG